MKNNASDNVEQGFSRLQKMEDVLEKKVDGYLSRTSQYENYAEYLADHNNSFSVVEKVRVADAIKMAKAIGAFEKEFSQSPEIKAFSNTHWEEQIKGQRLLVENNLQLDLFGDFDDGQIMIHNTVSNTHSVVDFDFVFDSTEDKGYIQLDDDGKAMFPLLESALKDMPLSNASSLSSVNSKEIGHLSVDTEWMVSRLNALDNAGQIMNEISSQTGPITMEVSRDRSIQNEQSELSM